MASPSFPELSSLPGTAITDSTMPSHAGDTSTQVNHDIALASGAMSRLGDGDAHPRAGHYVPPITRLTTESLGFIFSVLSLRDRPIVAAICKDWRAASNNSPIDVEGAIPLVELGQLINRTGTAPLILRISYDHPRRLAWMLLPHMHRVRCLSLTALASCEPGPLPTAFQNLLQAHSPQLVEFRLDSRRLPNHLVSGDLFFKQNAAPQVLSCALLGIRDGMSLCLTLFSLRELVVSGPMTDRDVIGVLATLEHLERLELHVTAWTARAVTRTPRIPPKSLKELCLTMACPEARTLAILEHSGIDDIRISFIGEYLPLTRDTIAACTGYPGTQIIDLDISLEVPVLRRLRFTIKTVDSAGRRRWFSAVPNAKAILGLTTLHFAKSITVDWLEVLIGENYPALVSLTVRSPEPWAAPSEQNLTRMDVTCPALQELTFVGSLPRADPPWWFISWLRESLKLEGKRKVPILKLRNVMYRPDFREVISPYAGKVVDPE